MARRPISRATNSRYGPLPRIRTVRRTVLDDLATLQHHHAVEIAQCRQPVRDRNDRAPAHQPRQRLADRFLGFAVERGSRLVEQQDRRILQEGARDRDALPLAARQLDAAVADHGRHALRQVSMKSQRAAIAARSTSSSLASGRP